MEGQGSFCPQCNRELNSASTRLVVDSCGHKKCRLCLLEDEDNCKQCLEDEHSVSKVDDNHTAVITYPDAVKHDIQQQQDVVKSNNDIQKNGNLEDNSTCVSNGKDENEIVKKSPKLRKPRKSKPTKRVYNFIVIPDHIKVLDPLKYECTVCKKIFSTKTHVKYHSYCISAVPRPYKCRMCPKEFVTKSQLNLHSFKHSDKKTYSCEICGKSFCESTKLKRHQLVHTHIKTHICSKCGKAFSSKDLLKVHFVTHSSEKPYKCSECDSRFNHASNLKKHLVSHSGEKVHMCDQCGKRFKLKWALTVHRKSHLRTRPHDCTVCAKTFINLKDLQRHQLIHLNSNLYSCSVCKTEFKRKDNLLRHIKNTHPGKNAEAIKISAPATTNITRHIVDNPNAIKVITASPLSNKPEMRNTVTRPDHRPGTVINGPLKLAFKTDAFKNNYNIHRDYEPPNSNDSFDLAESVNICQKILAPHNPPRNIIRKVSDVSSSEICQKILQPYSAPPALHYETSFEHKKYGSIRNIKFKLPPEYINLTMRSNDEFDEDIPENSDNISNNITASENKTYAELKALSPLPNAASVIVNTNSSQSASDMHWRRRTLQNLTLRNM